MRRLESAQNILTNLKHRCRSLFEDRYALDFMEGCVTFNDGHYE